jgi:hypothetical protein
MITFLLIILGLLLFTGLMIGAAYLLPDQTIGICEARDENLHCCLKEVEQSKFYLDCNGLSCFLNLCPEHYDKASSDKTYLIILDTRNDIFSERKAELEESLAKAELLSLKKARKAELERLGEVIDEK